MRVLESKKNSPEPSHQNSQIRKKSTLSLPTRPSKHILRLCLGAKRRKEGEERIDPSLFACQKALGNSKISKGEF